MTDVTSLFEGGPNFSPKKSQKIVIRKNGTIIKTVDFESGTELRMTLRSFYESKGQTDVFDSVPATIDDMTYEHALLLAGIEPDAYKIQVVEGPVVQPEHLIEDDLGSQAQLVIDLLPQERDFIADAISLIDMNSDQAEIKVAWAKGDALTHYLAQFGLKPHRNANKGMTFRDVINVVEKMKKVTLGNNSFSNYATRKEINLDDFVSEKEAASEEGVTLLAAKPIEGNAC